MTSGAQLFSNKDQASAYAKYRPTYPDELYEAIYEFAGPPEKGVALDVAAGAFFGLLPRHRERPLVLLIGVALSRCLAAEFS
jgi:hypothetical protein